jgi:hypothetical protein
VKVPFEVAQHQLDKAENFFDQADIEFGSWEAAHSYSMGMSFLCMQLSGVPCRVLPSADLSNSGIPVWNIRQKADKLIQ